MTDVFVKNPVLLVGEKDKVVAQMGENDLGVATDVEFYTKQEVDDLVAQGGGTSLPDQTGNAGKFLQTDGTDASWGEALVNRVYIAGNKYSLVVGPDTLASANYTTSVGYFTIARGLRSVALGDESSTDGQRAIAIGSLAHAQANRSIQLGRGSNPDDDTFKVANGNGNFEMMDANGNVPLERLTYVTNQIGDISTALTAILGE